MRSQGVFALRVLVFLLVFAIEVRVKAAEAAHDVDNSSLQQEPAGCLTAEVSPCALRASGSGKASVAFGGATVVLASGTTIVRGSENSLSLLDGIVWVRAKGPFLVKTEFGEVRSKKGDFWVWRNQEQMHVAAPLQPVEVVPRGASESLLLEAGWQNWLGKVGRDGRAETGLPQAISFSEHLVRWARLYGGTRAQFEKEVKDFSVIWKSASRDAAEVHHEVFARKVASLREAAEKRESERRRVEMRNRELRALFRRKVFDE